jgi:5-methylcytosine-specific restriction enzyme subunit McrC
MSGFTTREYEDIPVQLTPSSAEEGRRFVTPAEVDYLHALGQRLGERVIEHTSAKSIRFRSFVGLIRVGKRDIEILPKVDSPKGSEADGDVRKNLLSMLLCAHDTQLHIDGEAQSQAANVSWLDAFIQIFCSKLAIQTRKGLVKEYRPEEDDLTLVRGRLLLDEQLRRNFIHKERVACEFDELDENTPLNQQFKLSLTLMLSVARSAKTQRLVRETLVSFDSVGLRSSAGEWWRKIEINRLSLRFVDVKRLADLFLEGLSPDFVRGQSKSFAMLFDMNVLFEEYIGRQTRAALRTQGLSVALQHTRHFLMHDGRGDVFRLKPDIVVSSGENTCCIADTKWKRLTPAERKLGVSQSDLYQMLGYARRYACDRILLIYPFDRSAALPSEGRLLRYQAQSTTVLIAQVQLARLQEVPAQLAAMYNRAVAPSASLV